MSIEFSALFFGYFLLSKQKKVTKKKVKERKSDRIKLPVKPMFG